MPFALSRRARNLKPSATFRLARRAQELRDAGQDVLAFGLGEPDFDTPARAREAAHRAIDDGATHYTANEGLPALRSAIARSFERSQAVHYDPAGEILVTAGAKQALSHAILALVDEGDEVLVPKPYWLSYPEQVTLAGGTMKAVETRAEDGYHLTAEAVAAAAGPKSKILILNSPNNPTGAVLDERRLGEIADVCIERDLLVVSDEIYGSLVYGGARHRSIA
ncbi:MAG: aminotransferase class I/II-fold pyridoxal phosphate-dependent enzyme, partial [Planctomycetota bacterium JB042]